MPHSSSCIFQDIYNFYLFGSSLQRNVWGLKRVTSVPFNLTLETDILVSKKTDDRTRNLLDPVESTDGTENPWNGKH